VIYCAAMRGSGICCGALDWNSKNSLAIVLVVGNGEGFQPLAADCG
jgi:hypothetical protein